MPSSQRVKSSQPNQKDFYMKKHTNCRYCLKDITHEIIFHTREGVFCGEICRNLYQHSETFTIPPYPKESKPVQADLPFTDGKLYFGDDDHHVEDMNYENKKRPYDTH